MDVQNQEQVISLNSSFPCLTFSKGFERWFPWQHWSYFYNSWIFQVYGSLPWTWIISLVIVNFLALKLGFSQPFAKVVVKKASLEERFEAALQAHVCPICSGASFFCFFRKTIFLFLPFLFSFFVEFQWSFENR